MSKQRYRGHHDGGGGLLPPVPADPNVRRGLVVLYLVSVASVLVSVGLAAVLINSGNRVAFVLGILVFVVGVGVSIATRWRGMRVGGWFPDKGGHRNS